MKFDIDNTSIISTEPKAGLSNIFKKDMIFLNLKFCDHLSSRAINVKTPQYSHADVDFFDLWQKIGEFLDPLCSLPHIRADNFPTKNVVHALHNIFRGSLLSL